MKNLIARLKRDFRNVKLIARERKIITTSIGADLNSQFRNLVNPEWNSLEKYKAWFRSCEKSFLSQNGEDGILLSIFSEIGIANYRFIEFGIGDGKQCNAANLVLNYGWKGLMIEGSSDKARIAKNYYQNYDVCVLNEFITRDNINELFIKGNVTGDIDLLSIDIDGNDYWVWQAIEVVKPRVVVVEFNNSFGNKDAVTIPYDEKFSRFDYHKSGIYHGMSLSAAVKLGAEKGFAYVGCDSIGVNAYFIRKDQELKKFRQVSAQDFFEGQYFRDLKMSREKQQSILAEFNLVKV